MSDDERDLERRLDLMFGSARPRRGFEEELWTRIASRRSWSTRLGELIRPAGRLAPALAALLIVVAGAGILLNVTHRGGGAGSANSSSYSAAAPRPQQLAAFGRLPTLTSLAGSPSAALAPPVSGLARSSDANAAAYRFTGVYPILPGSLPVYRYREPSPAGQAALVKALQARTGLSVMSSPSRPIVAQEPTFETRPSPRGEQLSTPEAMATAFVLAHRLVPAYPHRVVPSSDGSGVVYARQFATPAGLADQVGPAGEARGLLVTVRDGLVSAAGPLEVPLDAADYPLRGVAAALGGPVGASPAADQAVTVLDSVNLVYVAVPAAGEGFYEPMLLFSGPAAKLLAPLLAADQLQG